MPVFLSYKKNDYVRDLFVETCQKQLPSKRLLMKLNDV